MCQLKILNMMKRFFFILLLTISFPVLSKEPQLLNLLKEKQANSQSLQKSIQAGNTRAFLCKFCHGEDGNSKKPSIPNLAAQNTTYLIRQFELFSNGQRKNKTMNELSRLLTAEDKVNIALFYNSQKVKPQPPFKTELKTRGQKIFSTKCFFCHGENGHGKAELPRIAGQPADYIMRTLSSYTAIVGKRAETDMSRVARALPADEINALAAYLSSLR